MTIRFGTDGWRAVISDTFAFANLRLIAQVIADCMLVDPKATQAKARRTAGPSLSLASA